MSRHPKHSPGPWRYCGQDRDQCKCGQVWSVPQDFNVAESIRVMPECGEITEEQMMANARLIAAAPEMYEVLSAFIGSPCANEKMVKKIELILDHIDSHSNDKQLKPQS